VEIGNRRTSQCIDVTDEDKRVKGAAARKAMGKKALDALQRATEAKIMAKKRVVVVRGELYYVGSRALKDAEALVGPHAVPEVDARGVSKQINIRWLWLTIIKEMVSAAFGRFGKINHIDTDGDAAVRAKGVGQCRGAL
jgi:hypothetical protein